MSRPAVRTVNRTETAKPIPVDVLKKPLSVSRLPGQKMTINSAAKDRKIENRTRKEEVKSVDKGRTDIDFKQNLLKRVEEKKQLMKKTTSDARSLSLLKNKIQVKGKTISKSAFSLNMTQTQVRNLSSKAKEFTTLRVNNSVFRCLNKPKLIPKMLNQSTEVKIFECTNKIVVNIERDFERRIEVLQQMSYRCISKPIVLMVKSCQKRLTFKSIHKPNKDIARYEEVLRNSNLEYKSIQDAVTNTDPIEFSEITSGRDSTCLHQNQSIFNTTSTHQETFPNPVSYDFSSMVTTPVKVMNSDYVFHSKTVNSSIQTTPTETYEIYHRFTPDRIISFDDFMLSISTETSPFLEPIQRPRFSLKIQTPKEKPEKIRLTRFPSLTQGFILSSDSPKFTLSRTQTDLSGIKFEISKREERLNKRRKAATRIQACFRAWKVRKDYIKVKLLEKELKLTHQLEELREKITLSWAPVRIYNALKAWSLKQKLIRAQIFEKFLFHCTEMIQKVWRGYKVRRIYGETLKKVAREKQLRVALLKGWKIRQIFKTKPIRNSVANIRDLQALTKELTISSPVNKSNDLLYKAQAQLPEVISKFISELKNLYHNGIWIQYKIQSTKSLSSYEATPCSPQRSDSLSFGLNLEELKTPSLNEAPIRPYSKDTIEIPQEAFENKEFTPVKKFNFLKRNKERYNPRSSSLNSPKKDIKKLTESKEYKELSKEVTQEDSNEQYETHHDEEPKNELTTEKKTFNFLKRRSQKMQPQKINWKVAKKIDCWGSKTLTEPRRYLRNSLERPASTEPVQNAFFKVDFVRPKLKKRPTFISRSGVAFKTLEELNHIFKSISDDFKPVLQFFSRESRLDESTEIPQITQFSRFIANISEYNIQKVSRDLEQKYLQLCSEDKFL